MKQFDIATAFKLVTAAVLILALTQREYGEALMFSVGALVVVALNPRELFR